jgi:hypothetical protein
VFDVNDRGDVIGEFRVGWGTYGQGYVRLAGQAWHRLVPEAVTHPTTAYAINGRGTVLGLFGGRNASWTANEFVWSSDLGRRELPVDFTAAPYRNWQPSMLNELDQVAGTTWEGDDDLAARYTVGGELEVIPVPTDHAYGTHINERGDVAGLTDQDELQGVFIWADITLPVRPAWPAGAVLTVVPGSESLAVSWPAASIEGGGAVSYRVSLDGGTPVVESGTSIVLSGLAPGTAYTVRVVAVDGEGLAGPVLSAVARTSAVVGGEPSYVTSLLTTYATSVGWEAHRAGDVTGNGYADLVSYHATSGRWWVTESLGAGSFAAPALLATYTTAEGWDSHLVGDVTGNGYADLVSYHPKRGRWWVTESLGAGGFAALRLLTTYATTEGWAAHLAADVTGDGVVDLVSYQPTSGRWWMSRGLGDGGLAAPKVLTTYNTRTGWDTHLAADVTGNGAADLLSYHPSRGRWWVTTDTSR